ncbi:MAG: small subunit ribosomal protein [Solirubrobacteraceae bacterium]|nr:small subunit ribosomal protein [Solirubrobacteraceae bacterium]
MAAPKPIYDLVLLLDADAPSERRQEILREVEAFVDRAGTIESKHDWGVRALSYEIQHHKEAEYHLLQFSGPGEMIERLRTMLRITDGVLRHRIIRVLPGTPDPPAMRPEPRRVPEGEGEPVAAAAPAAAAPVAEAATAEAPAAAAEAPAAAADAPAPAEAPAATAEAPAATPEAPAPAAEAPAAAEDAPPADDAPASA